VTVQQLRAALHGMPFRPFTFHMGDGRSFHVPHSDFLSMSPTGRTVIVYQQDDDFSIFDLLLMTEIEFSKPAASKP